MITVTLRDDYIKLGQALKAAGLVSSGLEAKYLIREGRVLVDGQVELRRGRKLYKGSVIEYDGREIVIESL